VPLARDRLHPRDVFLQSADLLQTFRLAHAELKLELEELVVQLMLLVFELGIGQVANLFCIYNQFPVASRQ